MASFTDADPNAVAGDYSVTINWGDGASSAGTVTANPNGGFNVTGSHSYAEEGTYGTSVTIIDAGGSTASATSTATIADAALSATGTTITGTEGAPATTVATFTDANLGATPADLSAAITWGDGASSAGTITANPSGGFNVTGSHSYAEEGTYGTSVTIIDAGGSTASVTSTAAIADAALSAAGTAIIGKEGATIAAPVASFTDADPNAAVGDYTATITWGDGTNSAGTITANPSGGFNVTGSCGGRHVRDQRHHHRCRRQHGERDQHRDHCRCRAQRGGDSHHRHGGRSHPCDDGCELHRRQPERAGE